ncbi:MAG TPA: GntR family transcriptional regulator [Alphaproteobacteria bacterium]|nr:GntR family transcriptional regulator [Alphaproteobacteria bacterium]
MTRYMELRQTLAAEIAAGAFAVGAKFPTEYELCDRFGVSRHTVREALRALEDQGLLARQAGLGTTVLAHTPATHYTSTLDSLGGLHDYATETAFEKQNEGFVTIRGGLAEILGREPGERWLRFAGLRRMVSDGSAICWTEIFVAEPYSADRGKLVRAEAPVYETIAREFGLDIQEVEQRVSALAMPREIAKALEVEPDKPALMTRRRYFAGGGTPFEISLSIHPGDRYAYTQRLHRK